jgi:hypothetical protein
MLQGYRSHSQQSSYASGVVRPFRAYISSCKARNCTAVPLKILRPKSIESETSNNYTREAGQRRVQDLCANSHDEQDLRF